MENLLVILQVTIKLGFFVWFAVLFCISVKKVYWKEGMSRIKLILVSFFTCPFVTYMTVQLVSTFIYARLDLYEAAVRTNYLSQHPEIIAVSGLSCSILYMIFIFAGAKLASKLLRIEEESSVIFLYFMFNAISVVSFRGAGKQVALDLIGTLILYVASWLMYRFDICLLAELKDIHGSINWKLFIIPPAILTFIYAILVEIMVEDKDFVRDDTTIILYIFTTIVICLLIWAFNVVIKNISATNEAVKAKDEAIEAKNEVKTLSVEVMEALAHTIDAKDEYTRGHSVRVAQYSRMLAKKLGMSEEDCENVYYMGLLHDIGKIGVPNEIINSPSKLTDEEYSVIKTHPSLGFDILSEIKSRPDLSTGARWHHERYDGKGYPDSKSGKDIPLMARIIAVADSYDAMTSNRSYRNYLPQDKVREELKKNEGTQFDPEIAEMMIAIMDEDTNYKLHE